MGNRQVKKQQKSKRWRIKPVKSSYAAKKARREAFRATGRDPNIESMPDKISSCALSPLRYHKSHIMLWNHGYLRVRLSREVLRRDCGNHRLHMTDTLTCDIVHKGKGRLEVERITNFSLSPKRPDA